MPSDSLVHCVYHLVWQGQVIYVGRSYKPASRLTAFEYKHGFRPRQLIFWCTSLQGAQKKEKRDILRLKSKFNKIVASSVANLGKQQSKHQKEVVSKIRQGTKLTATHKAKLWRNRERPVGSLNWFYGKKHKNATKKIIRKAAQAQFKDPVKSKRHRDACIAWVQRRKLAGLPFGRACNDV